MIIDSCILLLLGGLAAAILHLLVLVLRHGEVCIREANYGVLIAEIVAVSLIIIIAGVRLLWKIKRMF